VFCDLNYLSAVFLTVQERVEWTRPMRGSVLRWSLVGLTDDRSIASDCWPGTVSNFNSEQLQQSCLIVKIYCILLRVRYFHVQVKRLNPASQESILRTQFF